MVEVIVYVCVGVCMYVQTGHLSEVMQNGICQALLDVQHVSITIISHNTVKQFPSFARRQSEENSQRR